MHVLNGRFARGDWLLTATLHPCIAIHIIPLKYDNSHMTTLGVIILHSSVLALEWEYWVVQGRFCLICILLSQTLLTLLTEGRTDRRTSFAKGFQGLPKASLAYVHPQNNILKCFSSLQAYLQPFPNTNQTTQVCCLSLENFAYNFHKSEISAFFTATDYNYYKW